MTTTDQQKLTLNPCWLCGETLQIVKQQCRRSLHLAIGGFQARRQIRLERADIQTVGVILQGLQTQFEGERSP